MERQRTPHRLERIQTGPLQREMNRKASTRRLLPTAINALVCTLGTYPAACAAACMVENAHYQATSAASNATADDVVVERPLWYEGGGPKAAIHVRIPLEKDGAPPLNDWFIYDQGSSGMIHLLESTDRARPSWDLWESQHEDGPLHDVKEYYAWSDDHSLDTTPPMPGSEAPKYILLSGLDEALRRTHHMERGPGMFKLSRCDGLKSTNGAESKDEARDRHREGAR